MTDVDAARSIIAKAWAAQGRKAGSGRGQQANGGGLATAFNNSTAPDSGGANFSLADSNRKLKELLRVANETGVSNVVVDVADVSRGQATDLQNAGIDIDESFKHTVDVSSLRHAINRHSDPKIERSRNQIALVNGDFLKINEVVSNPDAYAVGPMSKRNLQMVAYIKDMGDGTILYIEEVRTSKSRMAMLSMRKFPSTKDFSSIAQTLLSNARSDAKEISIIYPGAVQSQDRIQSTLPPTIVINGVTRSTTNSKGQPIHPTLEGVRNFWKFFGDSLVVDADGKPLVVYHGTRSDFNVFDPEAEPSAFVDDRGLFFFTNNAKEASAYAQGESQLGAQAGQPNVMPVYLALKNPKIVTVEGKNTDPTTYYDEHGYYLTPDAKDAGNDGLVIDNLDTGEKLYVAFKNTLIKSAIGNNGNFDSGNPDINFSRSERATLGDYSKAAMNQFAILYKERFTKDA